MDTQRAAGDSLAAQSNKTSKAALLGGFVVAAALSLALNLAHLALNDWGYNLTSAYPYSDAYLYFHKAWFTAFIDGEGGYLSHVISYSPYSNLVVLGFNLFGPHATVPLFLNALLLSLTCGVLFLFTEKLFGLRAGIASIFVSVLCGVFIFYATLTLKTSFVLLGFSLSLYLSTIALRDLRLAYAFAALVVTYFVSYERDNILIVAVLLCFFFSWKLMREQGRTKALQFVGGAALCFFLAFSIPSSDKGIPNYFGTNFLVGNAPGAVGGYTPVNFVSNDIIGLRLGVQNKLKESLGREPTPAEAHLYLLDDALKYIANDPVAYFVLLSRKTALMFSQYAYGHPEQYAYSRWVNPITAIAIIDWSVLVAGLILGCWIRRHYFSHDTASQFLLAVFILYALSVIVFPVVERYRLPLYLIAIPFCAHFFSAIRLSSARHIPVFATLVLISISLNGVMKESLGWKNDHALERTRIEARQERLKQLIFALRELEVQKSPQSRLNAASTLMRFHFYHDARLILRTDWGENQANRKAAQKLTDRAETRIRRRPIYDVE